MKTLLIVVLAIGLGSSYGQSIDSARCKTSMSYVLIPCRVTVCQSQKVPYLPTVFASVYNTGLQVVKRDDFKHLPYTHINDIAVAEFGFYQRQSGEGFHAYGGR